MNPTCRRKIPIHPANADRSEGVGEGGWRGGGRRRGEAEMRRGRRQGEMREEGWGSAEGRGGENVMRAATGEGATTVAGFGTMSVLT